MFSNSILSDAVGLIVVAFVGAYVHYRVTTRHKQTRLAIGMLEQDDQAFVGALDRLIDKKDLVPFEDYFAETPPASPKPRRVPQKKISAGSIA